MNELKAFRDFIGEYTALFEEMAQLGRRQLDSIMARELNDVNDCAVSLQTFIKKLDSMEKKRFEIQKQAGFDGLTFSQIIDKLPADEKDDFRQLFDKLSTCISDVNFYNQKSHEQVRADLRLTEGEQPMTYGSDAVSGVYQHSSFEGKA